MSTHREREEYIRTLEKSVEVRTAMIDKIGAELKYVEDTLAEATYQVLVVRSRLACILCSLEQNV